MDLHHFVAQVLFCLTAALVTVPLFTRLGLSAILGYLVAGMLVGPFGMQLVGEADELLEFAEFGVVLLMFIIGLEMAPRRIWIFRRQLLGFGSAQVILSALVLGAAAWLLGASPALALTLGLALALSSTALVFQALSDNQELGSAQGRLAIGILLFQDLAVIPILALLPFLGSGPESTSGGAPWSEVAVTIGGLLAVMVAAHFGLRPLLGLVARSRVRELFTAAALILVIGAAFLSEIAGLSLGLGAFLAGVLVAESEYRHALEADIEPFRGLLLCLFFIGVGMTVDLTLIAREPLTILGLALGLMAIKAVILYVLGRVSGMDHACGLRLALLMPQGGEFAFVILPVALGAGLLEPELGDRVVALVAVSMLLNPLFLRLIPRGDRSDDGREADEVVAEPGGVVIIGFGRVGQIVGRVLTMHNIPFVALEKSPEQVDFLRRYGNEIYYGDATRLELLRAAGVGEAAAVVVAIDDVAGSMRVIHQLHEHFPETHILAVARNRHHVFHLKDLGINPVRATYYSSLRLSERLLCDLGYDSERSRQAVERFDAHDQALLESQHRLHTDEDALIQSAKEARDELRRLFIEDNRPENG